METKKQINDELSQLSAQITLASLQIEQLSKVRKELIDKFTPLYQKLASSADSTDTSCDQPINQ